MCFEILGFDIYIDKKAKPWLIETNLAPSFATDTNLDDELKRGVLTDAFRLLGVSHRERVRRINRKKEDMQKRIVERTSYKENLQKKKEELEKLRKKREAYERKNIGGYKMAYPSPNPEMQAKYEEYLESSVRTLPFNSAKVGVSAPTIAKKKSKPGTIEKSDVKMPKIKAKNSGQANDKTSKARDLTKKSTKSPYEVGVRRLVTPASQNRRKTG
jgi:hypothetical protein